MSGPDPNTEHEHEHLSFAEAGRRLGRSADAVRMAANRGALVTVEVDGRRRVVWPQPEREPEPTERETERKPEPEPGERRSGRSHGPAALELEVAELRAALAGQDALVAQMQDTLAHTQVDRDHWRSQAQRLAGLLEADRMLQLQAGAAAADEGAEGAGDDRAEHVPHATETPRDATIGPPSGDSPQPDSPPPTGLARFVRWLRGLLP